MACRGALTELIENTISNSSTVVGVCKRSYGHVKFTEL
jgi:hypothetical protein